MMSFLQQQNIGFRYAIDALEPSSPYGSALVTSLHEYAPSEAEALIRELTNVKRVLDILSKDDLLETETLCCEGLEEAARKAADDYSRLERLMMPLKDIRRSVEDLREGSLGEVELFELKRFCLQSELIAPAFENLKKATGLEGISILPQARALQTLDPENTHAATFYIPDGASRALASARKDKHAVEEKLRRASSREERDALTLERTAAAAAEDAEERRLREGICEALRPEVERILDCMDNIAKLDFIMAKAKLAARYGACLPEIAEGAAEFIEMVNPRMQDSLASRGRSFTPVTVSAPVGATVITGANMGGKSVALKTLALNALLVKCGMLPFAKSARLPLFGGVFIVSEDMEDMDRGLSSFGAEIVRFNETLEAVENTDGECMILLDEFARGTNPEEGAMIVRAVTRYLKEQKHVSALTTHYDGVAGYASAHYEVAGLRDMDMAEVAHEIASAGVSEGADVIASHMNYGLYVAKGRESCPRDARNICALLSLKSDILEDIK